MKTIDDYTQRELDNLVKSQMLIIEYYSIRSAMIKTTARIKKLFIDDTHPIDGQFTSNHVHDYFQADKDARNTEEGGMDFEEYCCDVLDMDEVCPTCSSVLSLIRARRSLGRKLGITKNKIMRHGSSL